jgi:plastocyanin
MAARGAAIATVIVVVLVASGSYYFLTLASPQNSTTITITVTNGTPQNGGADIFEPRNFTVTEGQQVTIVFVNTDDGPHELTIPAFNVDTGVVQGGQSTRVIFTPTRAGTFAYSEPQGVCSQNAGAAACTGVQETSGIMTVRA